ncbi:MAG: aspartyl protease family protein [Candidatus Obscuribacter sp.]|jgi:clan AA aspartic protease (TIGR02281 family)|nr:aspartyl protease family protein [Candidatus Obscuribacter sp.]MBP6594616.1 aspartyl protease family protein [Candidatus Obscuribacter sp.]MBP7576324.1 aspartyl protease family protein [Candidatus Obscuribacter sp.]
MRHLLVTSLLSSFLLTSLICAPMALAQGMNDGIKKFSAKDYDGAIKVFTSYVKTNPQSADAYYYLAASYHRQNRNADALKLYEYVSKNFPGSQAATYSQTSIKSMQAPGAGAAGKPASTASKSSDDDDDDSDIGPLTGPDEDRVPLHRGHGGHLMMTAYINGKSIEMMFDTGASTTVLSLDAWKALGNKAPTGPPTGQSMGVGGLSGTWSVPCVVGLGKFSRKMNVHLTESMPGNGLIGQTFFSDLQYNLSSGSDYVHLFKKGAGSASRSIPFNTINIPFRRVGNEMYVTATVNGMPLQMIFDTGAGPILIDSSAVAMLGIPIPHEYQVGMIGGVGGGRQAMIFKIDSLKLGEVEKRNIEVCVASVGVSLLGQNFFKDQHYVIDNDNKMIRFFH